MGSLYSFTSWITINLHYQLSWHAVDIKPECLWQDLELNSTTPFIKRTARADKIYLKDGQSSWEIPFAALDYMRVSVIDGIQWNDFNRYMDSMVDGRAVPRYSRKYIRSATPLGKRSWSSWATDSKTAHWAKLTQFLFHEEVSVFLAFLSALTLEAADPPHRPWTPNSSALWELTTTCKRGSLRNRKLLWIATISERQQPKTSLKKTKI